MSNRSRSNSIPSAVRPTLQRLASRPILESPYTDGSSKLQDLLAQLEIENKIKEGAENMLQVFDQKRLKDGKETLRKQAESALDAANEKITKLKTQVEEISVQPPIRKNPRRRDLRLAPESFKRPSRGNTPNSPKDETIAPLSKIMQDLAEPNREPSRYIDAGNQLLLLFRRQPTLKYDIEWEAFSTRICLLLKSSSKQVVALGYRLARQIVTDIQSIKNIKSIGIDDRIIRSLAKEFKTNMEREQAVKLVRSFLDVPEGSSYISQGVIRGLVAVAEDYEDGLQSVCLETLAEIVVLNPELIACSGGIRIFFLSLVDGPFDVAESVVLAIIYLLDSPKTRKYIRAGYDLDIALSLFTDFASQLMVTEERLDSSARIISTIFKSWPGFLSLCSHKLRAIRSFVDALRIQLSNVKGTILDILFDVFEITQNPSTSNFLAGRRLTILGRQKPVQDTNFETDQKAVSSEIRTDMPNQFKGLILAILIEVGLFDALVCVVEGTDEHLSRKAVLLLGEILQISDKILPVDICAKIQTLPRLFRLASDFNKKGRLNAANALYQIESLSRARNKSVPKKNQALPKRSQRQVEQVRVKMSLQIDDAHFRTMLIDSQILATKNYTKWRWDTILELIEGPLLNPKRLEETIKATTWMKRFLSFYRPFAFRFSTIKNTKPNQKYIRIGCAMFSTLLANPEGVRYLMENKLLRQIAGCLEQLDPIKGSGISDQFFSRHRLENTITSGYFTMLGTLSGHKDGLLMMERWKMFTMFHHLTDLRSREDLVKIFISALDYSLEGHSRIVMSKALTTGLKDVRLFATKHLETLVTNNHTKLTSTSSWAIRLIVTQLYDPSIEVCQMAVGVLDESCNNPINLEYVVNLRPMLDHLGEIGAPLLMRFLSTDVGFQYLSELDYIDKEMDDWLHGRCEDYVTLVEACLAFAHATEEETLVGWSKNVSNNPLFDGQAPPHFYGELAKTAGGCRVLDEKGHFEEFANFVKHNGMEWEDEDIVLKTKSCLWAIGNIGATEGGVPFLKSSKVVSHVACIAEQSQVYSLKGTAYFVLGLVSSTIAGLEMLQQVGWKGVCSTMGIPTGLCIPENLEKFLDFETRSNIDWPELDKINNMKLTESERAEDSEILKAVINLSNHILANEASRTLIRLRARYPMRFGSVGLYDRMMHLLGTYHFRQPMRKFIIELFGDLSQDRGRIRGLSDSQTSVESDGFSG